MTPAWRARAACGFLLGSISVHARQPSQLPPFEHAQHLRDALEARPESQRTRAAYHRVRDAYRAVYHHDPASPKADASVLAVAQLLAEEGRLFSDQKLLHDAIGQYEFLRVQYSRSHYHALIAEGEKQAHQDLNAIHHTAAPRPQHNAFLAAAIESQQSSPAAAVTPPAIQPKQTPAPSRPPPAMTPAAIQPSRPSAASVAGTVPAPQPDDGALASTTTASTTAGAPTSAPATSPSRKKPSPLHPANPTASDVDGNLSPPTHEAGPTAAGDRSLVRTLGLKIGRIVIDAGHGGHDSGTVGPGGIEEKQVVLEVALRLGKLLKQRLGADVIFTRDSDTFIPLETRTAIANKAQADLFLSIHANSSPDSSARGVETYYLNFTTSPDALEVAARENAVSDESIHELSDLVKDITLKDKIDASREFAADVQKSLYGDLEDGNPGLRDRGVKKAPFVVLIGANMPSILAEISFLTNSDDARQLQQPAYRQRIAESLYRGVATYISGLSGVRLAQSLGRPMGN
jgi:N-acetylmuramoyl-L-alanine amidase